MSVYMEAIQNNLNRNRTLKLGIFLFLVILNIAIWHTLSFSHQFLTVSFLNVGQGDGIYIKAPNKTELVIDGGPDQTLLSELGRVRPFFDRSIDMIIVTNPDKDHYAGFIDMLDRIDTTALLEPGTNSSTPTYYAFKQKVKAKQIKELVVKRGDVIMLDEKNNIFLEVLFPDRDASDMPSNEGSLVMRLVYGQTCIMLQGDSVSDIEEYLLSIESSKDNMKCQILKAGHHGSRTSTSHKYVQAISPEFAIISSGKDNRYGHPHQEVLETLRNNNVSVLRIDQEGRITFLSDGVSWKRK
jgi:competence protein ComEC